MVEQQSTPARSTHSGSRNLAAACALPLALFTYLAWRFWFVCDDAFIAFRYARNLTEHLGLRFNPGEHTPVEGFTELPWVLLCALFEGLHLDVAFWAPLVSCVCGAVLLLRVMARISDSGPLVTGLAGLFMASAPPLFVWSSGGLATVPFALTVFVAWEKLLADGAPRSLRASLVAGLWLALVMLMRADGIGWALTLGGLGLIQFDRSTWRRSLMPAAGVLAVGAVAITLWRLSYYGDWLPNTARAKLGFGPAAFSRGGRYLATMALAMPALALATALSLGRGLLKDSRARSALALVGATLCHCVLTGGDFMCFGRFLVPAVPFVTLLLARKFGNWKPAVAAAAGLGLVLLSLASASDLVSAPSTLTRAVHFRWNYPQPRTELAQWRRMDAQAREWRDLGLALAAHTQPGDSFTYGAMGAVGYYSRLFLYDHNGLVTREVARREPLGGRRSPGHDKTVPKEFFLKDKPTYLDGFLWPAGVTLPAHIEARRAAWIEVPLGPNDPRPDHKLFLEPGPGYRVSGDG
ncbi:MAG: hypothetical protein QF724_06255 [Planctomycetota bacterium]|nr:hypothetical protein [Planctomycetota bacterium]MDP6838522.1 hypothetical protein [Planctomycetota bacterium]